MNEAAVLASLTDLIGKQADVLLAMINFYGLVVFAVIGWIVNTGKESGGVSWFRIFLFNLGFLFFFAATFAAFWLLYDRLTQSFALWAELTRGSGAIAPPTIAALTWLPPIDWLWGLWGFNAMVLILATVLLRQGGFGRRPPPGAIVS